MNRLKIPIHLDPKNSTMGQTPNIYSAKIIPPQKNRNRTKHLYYLEIYTPNNSDHTLDRPPLYCLRSVDTFNKTSITLFAFS